MPLKVFISGASSGLGEALARHYASQGAILGLVARRAGPLQALATTLPAATAYVADVRDAAAMQVAASGFMRQYGCPDIVIANAGINRGTLTEYADDTRVFEDILSTNVTGILNTFQPFLTAMKTGQAGCLTGIASVAGYRGLPGGSAYSASKAAAITYLESLRVEMYGSGVSVVTICPGYVITPMTAVNPFPMPFLMTAEAMAEKIAATIHRKKQFAVIPWQMAIVATILRVLPDFLYDWLFAHAPRKPR
jgi:short-subunit dehydrogenase